MDGNDGARERAWSEYRRLATDLQAAQQRVLALGGDPSALGIATPDDERYRLLFESNPHPMWVFEIDTLRFLAVNNATVQHYGYTRDEFLGMTLAEIRPEEDIPALRASVRKFADEEGGVLHAGTWRHRLKDGRLILVEVSTHPVLWDGKRAKVALAVDVTERLATEQRAREFERRFQELANHLADVFYDYDAVNDQVLYLSPAFASVWGIPPEVIFGDPRAYLETIHPDDRGTKIAAQRLLAAGKNTEVEYRIVLPNGEVRWIQEHSYPILTGGAFERAIGIARDITERKQAVLQLESSERRFRLLSKATNDAIWDWDLATDEVWWNEGFESLFGHDRTASSHTSESWSANIHADDRERVLDSIHGVLGGVGDHWSEEYRFRHKSGQYAWVLDRGYIIRDASGRAVRMIGGMTDLSEWKMAEDRLAEQAALLDQASDAIFVLDAEDRICYWNQAAALLYGWRADEALGCPVLEVAHQDAGVFGLATSAARRDGSWSGESEHRTRQGIAIQVLARYSRLQGRSDGSATLLAIISDITDRKKLEQQVLRAQRMESIGTLAGGIAHDLNNVLSPILLSLDLLREQVQSAHALGLLDTVDQSAQRASRLVRQVLGFARGMQGERQPLDPRNVAVEIQRVVNDTFPKSILFRLDMEDDLWQLHADPTQLHQVLMNLTVNARDAMPGGGTLEIRLENVVLDEVYSHMNVDAQPGPFVVIEVKDSGMGIPRADLVRIFEPFFTTKAFGEGTGLGLSTTFSIVRDHGGFINVYSEPGKGTTFRVYLPATATPQEAETVAVKQTQLPCGHGELVLLVDDEASIREVARKTLERFGYRVITAENGAEGVSQFVRHQQEVAVVLTDMSMPIMDGPALVVALKSIDPDVLIVGSSGLGSNGNLAKAIGAGLEYFVPKPYTAEALLSTLRRVLSGEGGTPPAPTSTAAPVPEPVSSDAEQAEVPAARPIRPDGTIAVMIVDDTAQILRLAQRTLEKLGYTVYTADGGAGALALLDEHPEIVPDVVVTDLHMPGMSGTEFIQALRMRRGACTRFIVTSGDAGLQEIAGDMPGGQISTLAKPYSAAQLNNAIRAAIGE